MKYLLLIVCVLLSDFAGAHDTLFLKNRKRIVAPVVRVSPYYIYYRTAAWFSPSRVRRGDSDERHIRLRYVDHIHYADGRSWVTPEDYFVRRSDRTVVTLNFPGYFDIGGFPGISVGGEIESFIDKKCSYSAGFTINGFWAGTPEAGELRRNEIRSNLKGIFIAPNFYWHPYGNSGIVDIGLGASIPIGSLKRREHYGPPTPSHISIVDEGEHFFTAFLLKAKHGISDQWAFCVGSLCLSRSNAQYWKDVWPGWAGRPKSWLQVITFG